MHASRALAVTLSMTAFALVPCRTAEAGKDMSSAARLRLASTALGRSLSQPQKKAILKAHLVGAGEKGTDGRKARIGHYTKLQLLKKARILGKAGFTQKQRRTLMRRGVVGFWDDVAAVAENVSNNLNAHESLTNIVSGQGTMSDYLGATGQHQSSEMIKAWESMNRGDQNGAYRHMIRGGLSSDRGY